MLKIFARAFGARIYSYDLFTNLFFSLYNIDKNVLIFYPKSEFYLKEIFKKRESLIF